VGGRGVWPPGFDKFIGEQKFAFPLQWLTPENAPYVKSLQ